MNAPFVYFGGKRDVAPIVWDALGEVATYIEPFFGSGAVLLNRPGYSPEKHFEIVNDADGHLSNVWRALQADPDAVAAVCDWPVNHADLAARRKQLYEQGKTLLDHMISDDKYYDVQLAGYWIWCAGCWIGDGMTQAPKTHGIGKIPNIGNASGVHKKTIMAMKSMVDHAAKDGIILDVHDEYLTGIYAWFRELSERLRTVRVVCGDWMRVCGGNWHDKAGVCGIFLDPPYATETREMVYSVDSTSVAHDVREWAFCMGKKRSYRIVLAGYYDEHKQLLNEGWKGYAWEAVGGFANQGKEDSQGKQNKRKEHLFLSPHCLKLDAHCQLELDL
jgi:DNA adenine methylase